MDILVTGVGLGFLHSFLGEQLGRGKVGGGGRSLTWFANFIID